MLLSEESPEAGVLDEPDSAKPAQLSSNTGPPSYIGWKDTVPAYVDCLTGGLYGYFAERG